MQLCSLCVVGLAGSVVSNIDHVENLDRETRSAGLFVVVVACLALLVEVVILVVRFLNIGIINLHMRKFLIAVRMCIHIHCMCVSHCKVYVYLMYGWFTAHCM